jgi:predicted acylesterase/phospholipase RssA
MYKETKMRFKYSILPVILVVISSLSFSLFVKSDTSQPNPKNNQYYVAIKGGISLGSYETGLNWVLLQAINNPKKWADLSAFSGASAGSLNSLLSVITQCQNLNKKNNTLFDNYMRKSWDLGLPELLGNKGQGNAVFTRAPLEGKVKNFIKPLLESNNTKPCNLTISMSVTRMNPYLTNLGKTGEIVGVQRFVVPLKVKVEKAGDVIKFYNTEVDTDYHGLVGPYLKLESKSSNMRDNGLLLKDVIDLSYASSAFPFAFSPVPLNYCFANKLKSDEYCHKDSVKIETANFSDGGLFDNSPLGVAVSIANKIGDKARHQNFVYINPDHYRTEKKIEQEKENLKSGLWDYADYLMTSFGTAQSRELRDALVSFNKNSTRNSNQKNRSLYISERYHNLLADFHAHFAAFYSPDFRRHDYLVGVYDGLYLEHRIACTKSSQSDKFSENDKQCVEDKLKESLLNLTENPGNKVSLNFVKHLYNTEFGQSITIKDKSSNLLIALASAFADTSKFEFEKLKREQQYTLDENGNPETTGAPFAEYFEKLRNLLKTNFSQVSLDAEGQTYQLTFSFHAWMAENMRKGYDNLLKVQNVAVSCKDCVNRKANQQIGNLLKFAKPVAESYFKYSATGVWPLAQTSFISDRMSHTLRYGYDISEKSQSLSFASRYLIMPGMSADFNIQANLFGTELQNDHYQDISLGLTWHKPNIALSTLGAGYEQASKGSNIYKEKLDSIYFSVGLINEMATVKYVYRLDDINKNYSLETRENYKFSLQFDLIKAYQLIRN